MQDRCINAVRGKRVIAVVDTCTITLNTYVGRITNFDGIGIVARNIHKSSYGFFMHPIYVIDEKDGTPYGMADVHMFNRSMQENKLSNAERKRQKVQKSIEEKESFKWVGPCVNAKQNIFPTAAHTTFVMDREADIWEVFERIPGDKTDLVVRTKENRRIINSKGEQTKLYTELANQKALGTYEIKLPNKKGRSSKTITVEIKTGSCQIRPSQFNNTKKTIPLSYVEVKEVGAKGTQIVDPIHWILWTNREIKTKEQAQEIVVIYGKRWGIEVFFKLIKSDGYDIEKCQLETGRGIRKLTLIIMESASRVLQLKSARSGKTELKVREVFEEKEIECLKLLNKRLEGNTQKQKNPYSDQYLSWASWIIARLAGWKEFYEKDNPPGNKTFMRGLEKFDALMIGFSLAT